LVADEEVFAWVDKEQDAREDLIQEHRCVLLKEASISLCVLAKRWHFNPSRQRSFYFFAYVKSIPAVS
jgi:hypothetical protein